MPKQSKDTKAREKRQEQKQKWEEKKKKALEAVLKAERAKEQAQKEQAEAEKKLAEFESDSSESSSDDSSSSSDASTSPVQPTKAGTPAQTVKKGESSSDDSSSSSEESDTSSSEAVPTPQTEKKTKASDDDSDSSSEDDSSSSSEESMEEDNKKPKEDNDKKRKAEPQADQSNKKPKTIETPRLESQANTKIFCRNLSFKIQDEDMKEFLKDCGEVKNIHWIMADGKFMGKGIVQMDSAASVQKALAKNGQNLMDRPIAIEVAADRGQQSPGGRGAGRGAGRGQDRGAPGAGRGRGSPAGGGRGARQPTPKTPGAKTIYLGNLPYDVDEAQVREFLKNCGSITGIRWVERDGQFRGCGFVDFEHTDSTDKAVALAGSDLGGRPVNVDHVPPSTRRS